MYTCSMKRPIIPYHNFLPSDLDLEIYMTCFWKTLTLFIISNQKRKGFHICIPCQACDKTIHTIPSFLTWWPCPYCLTLFFFKNLNLVHSFWTEEVGVSHTPKVNKTVQLMLPVVSEKIKYRFDFLMCPIKWWA